MTVMPLAHDGHMPLAHDGYAASTTVMPLAHDDHAISTQWFSCMHTASCPACIQLN